MHTETISLTSPAGKAAHHTNNSVVDAVLAFGQYFTDQNGNKFFCPRGVHPSKWALLGISSKDTVFFHFNKLLEIDGTVCSINDHIEQGRLTAQCFHA